MTPLKELLKCAKSALKLRECSKEDLRKLLHRYLPAPRMQQRRRSVDPLVKQYIEADLASSVADVEQA